MDNTHRQAPLGARREEDFRRTRKEPNRSRTLAAALVVCAAAVPVRSEEPVAAAPVGEVVITPSRRPVAVENTPAVVDVITAEEIARTPATTLADLLETKAGIYTCQPQGTGIVTPQDVRLRGTAGAHWEVFAGNTLSFGAEWTRIWAEHTIESESTGDELAVFLRPAGGLDTQETNFALFVQDDWTFLDDRLELVLGGRYDNYGETEDAFSPKGSLIWRYLATGRAKLSAGRAFRAPSVSERKSPFWNLTVQPYPFPVVPPPGAALLRGVLACQRRPRRRDRG